MTKITKVTPQADVAKLASYRSQAEELATFLAQAPCTTADEESWFSTNLSAVRGLIKSLEDERTSLTKPILETKARVDALFTPATAPLKRCEVIIRGKLADAAKQRFLAEAESRRLAADAAAQDDFATAIATLASVPDAVRVEGSSARVTWSAKVVDFAALPDAYKQVDERALAAAGKGTEQPAQIPGVVWEMEAKVRAK